ncbi:hypothetical protein ACJJTC_015730 [Scirpophaga incertulas]
MNQEGPIITLSAANIPIAQLEESEIILNIQAIKPRTVRANTIVLIKLPPEIPLEFETKQYKGKIKDNLLDIQELILSQGYEDENIHVEIQSDYSSFFAYSLDGNKITLTMSLLDQNVINENTFLNLQIVASNARTSASAIVTLEIIKNDISTPVFDRVVYSGSYSLESIPESLFEENEILLTIHATKPRTVGASATIIIKLPSETPIEFETQHYQGRIKDNVLEIPELILSQGYENNLQSVEIQSEYSSFFSYTIEENKIKLSMEPLDQDIIESYSFLSLQIVAFTSRSSAMALVTLEIIKDDIFTPVFDSAIYTGSYDLENGLTMSQIAITQGYDNTIKLSLTGEYQEFFKLTTEGSAITLSVSNVPVEIFKEKEVILIINANKPRTVGANAVILITIPPGNLDNPQSFLKKIIYIGTIIDNDLELPELKLLQVQESEEISIEIESDYSSFFQATLDENKISLTMLPLDQNIIQRHSFISLKIIASTSSQTTFTVITLEIIKDDIFTPVFDKAIYNGEYDQENGLSLSQIVISQGYDETVEVSLQGDHAQYFEIAQTGQNIQIVDSNLPSDLLSQGNIVLSIKASKPRTVGANAAILIALSSESPIEQNISFEKVSYLGYIKDNTASLEPIVLREGYTPDVNFRLHGDLAFYFNIITEEATVKVVLRQPIPEDSLPTNMIIVLELEASSAQAGSAYATIILDVTSDDEPSNSGLVFSEPIYTGSYTAQEGFQFPTPISLSHGYDDTVTFVLDGNNSQWFELEKNDNSVRLTLITPIPAAVVANNDHLLFFVSATRGDDVTTRVAIIIHLPDEAATEQQLGFERVSYLGYIKDNTASLEPIVLREGYTPDVNFRLHGDLASYFNIITEEATVKVVLRQPIPEDSLPSNMIIVLELEATSAQAGSAYATIILDVTSDDEPSNSGLVFSEPIYTGSYTAQEGFRFPTPISLSHGYDDTVTFVLDGNNSQWFELEKTDNSVRLALIIPIPAAVVANNDYLLFFVRATREDNMTGHVVIMIHLSNESLELPNLTFSADSYVISVNTEESGQVGRVEATADNGESIVYILNVDNEHLRSRLSITSNGELLLSAPADAGSYTFQVVATTINTQAETTAMVYLTVVALTPFTAPIVVINRDEEEPHSNLLILDPEQHAGCRYSLANRWPENQKWLYVDDTGLHTLAIDREDPSIAFMALSQVQIELTLHCDNDSTRIKRSTEGRLDWLGPYDYGKNTWILGNTTEYNPRKTIVNLIVNDINDNYPIFIGKEYEPIVVGYPEPYLQAIVLPRSLIELQATDADVGENAALKYWSSETHLAVSDRTGFVHVKNGIDLRDDMLLTVVATDRNGQGLSGNITLMVKLLNRTNIAVITIDNAFLEDETRILNNLSTVVSYEIKALTSVVVPRSDESSKNKRNVEDPAGPSLQIYIYGLIDREPVSRYKYKINDMQIDVVRVSSLEDHLKQVIMRDSYIGLLAATIVLSILLLIIIVVVTVWYILIRVRKNNYANFSDSNSIASENDIAKPETNIELKRSEKRLQDMLNAPIEPVSVAPSTSKKKSDVVIPISDPIMPIVIQDKLKDVEESDDDEFGESKKNRRKSVVTFNENVEKIIHMQDSPQIDKDEPEYEIYKL